MEFLEPPAHGFDCLRQGGGSAGKPDDGDTTKPFWLQFFRALNVQRSFAGRPTGLDQLTRVVALAATNNHDDLYRRDQSLECELPIFGRFTNRIGKPDFCVRMRTRNFCNQRANPIDWLRRLRNNPVTSLWRKITDITDVIDDACAGKIANQAADFDVIGQTDHHGKIAAANETLELVVRISDERTGAIGNGQAKFV
jgi:hypothetical protein